MEITSNRRVFTNEELDYTFIEIMDSDKIFNINEINRLLKIDQDIFLEGKIPLYVNVDIFILQFPKGNELSFSVGQIKRIDKKNMEYNASTYYGSSGSPIIRRDNYSIIGLHLGSKKDMEKTINEQECFKNNFGVTILAIINDLIVKMNKKSPNSSLSFNKNDNFSNLKKYDKLGLLKYKSKNCKLFTLVNSMKCNFYFSENFPKNVTSGLDNRLGIRLHNEMRDLKNYFYEGFQIYGFINNILIGALEGPPSSPYENGFFIFEIFLNDYPCYPMGGRPPQFIFKTKIFHPNIGELGFVSVDILKDQFSPLWTLTKIIMSVQSLLCAPNPYEFINGEAATLYKENRQKYEEKVKEFTKKYANFIDFQNNLSKYEKYGLKIEHLENKDYNII